MTGDEIHAQCLSLPGAHHVVQWGDARVYKVGTKVFAILPPGEERISVKCADAETAEMLIAVGAAEKAPYLPRGGWVSLAVSDMPDDEMRERIATSYATVRASLPKKDRAALT